MVVGVFIWNRIRHICNTLNHFLGEFPPGSARLDVCRGAFQATLRWSDCGRVYRATGEVRAAFHYPEGPSTQILGFQAPKTIQIIVFRT